MGLLFCLFFIFVGLYCWRCCRGRSVIISQTGKTDSQGPSEVNFVLFNFLCLGWGWVGGQSKWKSCGRRIDYSNDFNDHRGREMKSTGSCVEKAAQSSTVPFLRSFSTQVPLIVGLESRVVRGSLCASSSPIVQHLRRDRPSRTGRKKHLLLCASADYICRAARFSGVHPSILICRPRKH